jgi:signal transduction histidine kinase
VNALKKQNVLRSFISSIGGKYALANETIALALAVSLIVNLSQIARTHIYTGAHFPLAWVVMRLVATIGFFLVLLALRPRLLPVTDRAPRPAIAILIYLALPIFVTRLDIIFFPDLVAEQPSLTVVQTTIRSLVFNPFMVFLVTRYLETSELAQVAIAERERLLETRATIHFETQKIVEQTKQSIAERIEPAISEIMQLLRTQDVANSALLTRARDLLETSLSSIVRPVSRELLEAVVDFNHPERQKIFRRFTKFDYPIELAQVIKPSWSAALVSVEIFLLSFANFTNALAQSFIYIYVGIFTCALILIRKFVRLPNNFAESQWTWLLLLVGYATISVISATITDHLGIMDNAVGISGALAVAIPLSMSNTALSFFAYSSAATKRQINDLNETNAELLALVSAARRELWAQQSRLSWILHGPIQSAIVSASAEIHQGYISEEQRESILNRLQDAIAALNRTAHNTIDLDLAIAELTTVWSRVCQITTAIDPKVVSAISPSASEFESIVELVREGMGNAVRHAKAKTIDLTISESSPNVIEILLINDGGELAATAPQGLGSRLYDQVATSWTLTSNGGHTTLRAILDLRK